MTFSLSSASPSSLKRLLVDLVARAPARVQVKLLLAFLTLVGLLIVLGAVGLRVLSGVNEDTGQLIKLQRKIAAYRQVQHDTTNQLYNISTALLLSDDRMLDSALRQLGQFGYDLDRMEFVARDEADLLTRVRQEYEKFAAIVTNVVDLVRSGRTAEARELQVAQIVPLADRLERLTNQLVNVAEADMVGAIDASARAYRVSQLVVIAFSIGSILLGLLLGYIISSSLIEPVKAIEAKLRRIGAGDFTGRVEIANNDELGVLAANVNHTSEELGRLYREIEARTRELSEALQHQTATAEVLKAISRSTFDLDTVLRTLVESAAGLCNANVAQIFRWDGRVMRWAAGYALNPAYLEIQRGREYPPQRSSLVGRVAQEKQTVLMIDCLADADYAYKDHAEIGNIRTMLGVPLLRSGELIGAIGVARDHVERFSDKQVEIVTTFADQAVIAIENVRLFEELQARTGELARSVGELQALGEVSQAVNSTLDLKTVLQTIVTTAVRLSQTDAGAIYVFSKSRQLFRLRATSGMTDELIAAISEKTIGLDDPGIGDACRLRAPVEMADLELEPASPVHDLVLDAGFRSVLVVPLLRPSSIVGALVVRRRRPGAFAPSTIDLLETFAAQSVLAIQNARLFSEVEEKSRQLEIASRHKSQFLANMSHELRTPLNSVLGFSEMLADGLYGDLPEKAKTTLARVRSNGRHLLGLINDVLDLSKIEAGQFALVNDHYAVGQIVRTVATATEPLARAKGLELVATIPDNMPLGVGDERRLTQVLLNLAGNAVKFTDKGSVEISARALDGHFEIKVRDTGPGIAAEHQKRIFEEFQQVDDSSTRKKGGTGLGLAISKRIVEMHGGEIGVDSTLGEGSTFWLTVPIKADEKGEAA